MPKNLSQQGSDHLVGIYIKYPFRFRPLFSDVVRWFIKYFSDIHSSFCLLFPFTIRENENFTYGVFNK